VNEINATIISDDKLSQKKRIELRAMKIKTEVMVVKK